MTQTTLATCSPRLLAECAIFLGGFGAIPLLDDVVGPGPWTLLVPTDAAFVNLSTEALDRLLDQALPLTELLRTHLVHGIVAGRDLAGEGSLLTARGDSLPVDAFGEVILIDGAQVIHADEPMTCGIAHVIDRVLGKTASSDRSQGAVG